MTNKKTKFKKLVFFDEQAALDILDVEQGGSTERIVKGAKEFAAGVDGSAQAGMGFFSSLKVKLSGNAKASVTNLIETQLKSTILTDFLTLIDKKTVFVDIENYKLRLTDDSTAYFRTLFRYLRMVKDVKG